MTANRASPPRACIMWSGPRNISTAMMRAFENRPDTIVWDEPFYAAYLEETGLDHPMRDEIIAAGPSDWREVVRRIADPPPDRAKPGARFFYQKHMTHHMIPVFDRSFARDLPSCFLIRDPARVLASYVKKRADVTLEDIGLPQQVALFEDACQRTGSPPLVLDAVDVLSSPAKALAAVCRAYDMPFSEAMLSWPPGRRASDGVWAPAWYDAVERTTGFQPADQSPPPALPLELQRIAEAAGPLYERLARHRECF